MEYGVLVPWTYDNIGAAMSDSDELLNVPYEQFAHTLGTTSEIKESLILWDEIKDFSAEMVAVESGV